MSIRQLGTTGRSVSRIGLGLAALGRPAYVTLGRGADLGRDRSVAAMERRCHELLDAAYAGGIRYVDAARSYGLSETFLASWLTSRQLPSSAITVGSKWGYAYTGGWDMRASVHEVKNLSVETLRRQWRETQALLGGRVDLYQIHSATLDSGVLSDADVIGELMRIRSAGVAIGLTVTGPTQGDTIRRAIEVKADGVGVFQAVQSTWNLLEPSAGPALAEAHDRGWGVIVKEVFANGRLTDQHVDVGLAPLRALAHESGTTIDRLAVRAALAQPWAGVVLSGAVTSAQLESHLRAIDEAADARGDAVWIDALPSLAESPADYWQRRKSLAWG